MFIVLTQYSVNAVYIYTHSSVESTQCTWQLLKAYKHIRTQENKPYLYVKFSLLCLYEPAHLQPEYLHADAQGAKNHRLQN